jgi:ATP-dependent exoDNAse (exonuclease V) alpha subunit
VKGRRCWARKAGARVVWVTFDNGQDVTLPRIPMQKVSNGIKFRTSQVPLGLIYAVTVHRSQGMTLNRA